MFDTPALFPAFLAAGFFAFLLAFIASSMPWPTNFVSLLAYFFPLFGGDGLGAGTVFATVGGMESPTGIDGLLRTSPGRGDGLDGGGCGGPPPFVLSVTYYPS